MTPHNPGSSELPRGTIVACIVVGVIGFLIYTGHSAHLMGFIPYVFLLACPLMHLFMHGGHHHHGHHHDDRGEPTQQETSSSNNSEGGQP